MTIHEIKRRFPHASADLIRLNLDLISEDSGPPAKLECDPGNGPLAEGKSEKANPTRYVVRVTSIRNRLLDTDNICPKFHVDALRYGGFIPDDNPEQTTIICSQRKTEEGESESTIIEITKES